MKPNQYNKLKKNDRVQIRHSYAKWEIENFMEMNGLNHDRPIVTQEKLEEYAFWKATYAGIDTKCTIVGFGSTSGEEPSCVRVYARNCMGTVVLLMEEKDLKKL